MPRTVDSAVLSVPSLSALDSSEDGSLPTLTSGSLEDGASKACSIHPSDTSYGLSSLQSRLDDIDDDFVKLHPMDEAYIAGARRFIASQPVFKKKLKIRVTRRMQVVVRSRVGYTQLRREVVRRKPSPAFALDEPCISSAFAQLSLRSEKTGQMR